MREQIGDTIGSVDVGSAFIDEYDYVEEFDALSISVKKETPAKYPGKEHARSVAKHLGVKEGLIYLAGQPSENLQDSDQPVPFRQRRYFFYLSGADFEDCALTYDIGKDDLKLFIPSADPQEVIWVGPVPSVKECESRYDVNEVHFKKCLDKYILDYVCHTKDPKIYLLHKDQVPSVVANVDFQQRCSTYLSSKLFDSTVLQPAMDAARVIKSEYEISQIRRANEVTAAAHRAVLTRISKLKNETEIEAVFQAICVSKGAKKQAYGPIAASGENPSTLHYVANNEPLKGRLNVCIDAGCEWNCYASDVTRSFPISGTWTPESKEIYDLVDTMQRATIARIRPGVIYRELHALSMYIAVTGLMKLGVLHNGSFGEVYSTGVAFYPHGLGHHLGLECHDVTAYQRLLVGLETQHDLRNQKRYVPRLTTDSTSSQEPGREYTKHLGPPPYTRQQRLAKGMVVTVEPGIYFSRYAMENVWLKHPKHSKYINKAALEKYYPVGGVRIEDDILVTEGGWENLTSAPKGEEALRIIRGEEAGEEDWL